MSSFVPPPRAKDGGIEAPMSLGGLFADSDSDDEEERGEGGGFDQEYSEQTVQLCEVSLIIRQYCWHMANANKVWPGTFTLAEFMASHGERYGGAGTGTGTGDMLELGAATGALSLFLRTVFPERRLCTSDIDDGGDVACNIQYNFERNGLPCVPHVAHTWGQAWSEDALHLSATATAAAPPYRFTCIVASDILLYVSAYPALVKTLKTFFLLGSGSSEAGREAGRGGALSPVQRPPASSISPEHISANITRLFGCDATLTAPAAVVHKKKSAPPVAKVDEGCSLSSLQISDTTGSVHTNHSSDQIDSNVVVATDTDPDPEGLRWSPLFEVEFLMSWQRRIAASETFFQLMRDEGFHIHHHGKCVYSFFLLYNTATATDSIEEI